MYVGMVCVCVCAHAENSSFVDTGSGRVLRVRVAIMAVEKHETDEGIPNIHSITNPKH